MNDYILLIETATGVCSVAVLRGETVAAAAEADAVNSHASQLTVLIEQVLGAAGIEASALAAVAVSAGPGSYTGLRIGMSVAKGICFAVGCPLIAVSTLEALAFAAYKAVAHKPATALFVPMIDARRMEVYTAVYALQSTQSETTMPLLTQIKPPAPVIITPDFLDDIRSAYTQVYTCGDGAAKCSEVLPAPPFEYVERLVKSSALYLAPLALTAFRDGRFENLAYYEPTYLKGANITVSKKNTLA